MLKADKITLQVTDSLPISHDHWSQDDVSLNEM